MLIFQIESLNEIYGKDIHMTTRIFFENSTIFNFIPTNMNGQTFTPILANGVYSLRLPYSQSWNTQYNMIANGGSFNFIIDVSGQISQITPNSQIYVIVENEENNVPSNGFPPQLKTSDQVHIHGHLQGIRHNKLRIAPINNMFARVKPVFAPYVPDRVVRLDFTG
jgi:hypothetical protein